MPDMDYAGACLCGAVTFGFRGSPRFVSECFCVSCRRAHGASVIAWAGVETERFELLDPSDKLRWFNSSEESERGFCVECGSTLFFRAQKWPEETHMALACINSPHDLMVTSFSFEDELPNWSHVSIGCVNAAPS